MFQTSGSLKYMNQGRNCTPKPTCVQLGGNFCILGVYLTAVKCSTTVFEAPYTPYYELYTPCIPMETTPSCPSIHQSVFFNIAQVSPCEHQKNEVCIRQFKFGQESSLRKSDIKKPLFSVFMFPHANRNASSILAWHHDWNEQVFSVNELISYTSNLSHIMRKPAFCKCKNKGADQLHDYRAADQRLCFRYTDTSKI